MKYQSAAPFFLYDQTYGFDRESKSIDLFKQALIRPDATSLLFNVFNAEEIERKPAKGIYTDNEDWGRFVRDNFDRDAKSEMAGCYLTALNNVYINNGVIYFGGTAETTALYEMHWPPDRPSTAINHNIHLRQSTNIDSNFDRKRYFYLGGSGSANYGHWLTDDLPRLAALERYREADPNELVTILITESGSSFVDKARRDTIVDHPRLSDATVQFIDPAVNYHLDRVLYATPVSYHPLTKLRAGIRYVRDTYGRTDGQGSRRIFMTRPPSSLRKLTNGDVVETFLAGRGFEVFDAGAMTFAEQVSLFSDATVVVGLMGAAMTNTIFSAPGTSLVHLSCKGWQEPYFWDLADACRHDYACIYGDIAPGETTPYSAPFSIDLSYLETALHGIV